MARTYLERHLAEFENASRDELIKHGIRALKESLGQDKELTVENTSLGITGYASGGKRKLDSFKLFDGVEIGPLLEAALEGEGQIPATGGEETTTAAEGGESMEVDE